MAYTRSELKGKVAIVTGANTGIGRVTAHELAALGMEVHLACRSPERAQPVVAEIRAQTGNAEVHLLQLDLASFASIREASKTFLDKDKPLELLINNAGLCGATGLTEDGFELTFTMPLDREMAADRLATVDRGKCGGVDVQQVAAVIHQQCGSGSRIVTA